MRIPAVLWRYGPWHFIQLSYPSPANKHRTEIVGLCDESNHGLPANCVCLCNPCTDYISILRVTRSRRGIKLRRHLELAAFF